MKTPQRIVVRMIEEAGRVIPRRVGLPGRHLNFLNPDRMIRILVFRLCFPSLTFGALLL